MRASRAASRFLARRRTMVDALVCDRVRSAVYPGVPIMSASISKVRCTALKPSLMDVSTSDSMNFTVTVLGSPPLELWFMVLSKSTQVVTLRTVPAPPPGV